VLKMRREGLLSWSFIADATRWRRKAETWDSVEDALRQTQRTYRRNLWRSLLLRIEVWLEKDALAGVIAPVTERWDVSLIVSRGTSSATFLHAATETARQAWVRAQTRTVVLALYDYDAAGRRAFRAIERALCEDDFAAPPTTVDLIAVTEEQIDEWDLPTRPAKASDPEAHKFGAEAVELDAIPPDRLQALVDDASPASSTRTPGKRSRLPKRASAKCWPDSLRGQRDRPGLRPCREALATTTERAQVPRLVAPAQLDRDDVIDLGGERLARAAEAITPQHPQAQRSPGSRRSSAARVLGAGLSVWASRHDADGERSSRHRQKVGQTGNRVGRWPGGRVPHSSSWRA
jgi:hypothetical protein